MDENKLKVLKNIGYKINEACGLCRHGIFSNNVWGVCSSYRYDHLKHNDTRDLSIHKFGSCKDGFEMDETKKKHLNKFEEFLKV